MNQKLLLLITFMLVIDHSFAQSFAINTDGGTADASAMLDIKSNLKGVLIPRMTKAERTSIPSPATGLLVFQNAPDSAGFYYYDGSKWNWMAAINGNADSLAWKRNGNSGTNAVANFIGTTDNQSLNFRVNNIPAGFIHSSNNNTAFGLNTLQSITTGLFNTAIGNNALFANADGVRNTAGGSFALQSNISGTYNTAIGYQALNFNTHGYYNTALGHQTLFYNSTGTGNIAIGNSALYSNTTGGSNTFFGNIAIGNSALYSNITGVSNVANGNSALYSNTTGNNNTALGTSADVSAGNLTNATAIGFGTIVNASNKIRLGNAAVLTIEGQVAYTSPSDGRFKTNISENIKGLDFIMKLRPVSYNFQAKKYDEFIRGGINKSEMNSFSVDYSESEKIFHNGFIAQEVEKVAKEIDYEFDGIIVPKNDNETYGLAYSQFVIPLVKAVQEQQKQIEELKKLVVNLKAKIKE